MVKKCKSAKINEIDKIRVEQETESDHPIQNVWMEQKKRIE